MANQFRRKFLSLTLALCLLLSLTTPVMAASNDITGHWAESTLNEWIGLGLIAGDGNGTYRPNDSITRAEFFTLVNNWKGYTAEGEKVKNYTDVSPDKWYYKQVAIALGAGYITGSSETAMSPEAKITRQEAMTVVARIAGLQAASDTSVLEKVKDGAKVASWAKAWAAAVINDGLISGGGDGNINPLNNITRAETVVLLNKVRVDTRSYAFAGTYGPTGGTKTVKNVEIDAPGVTLQNMTVTGDLTIAKSVGEGEATLNNVTVQGKLNVLGGGLNSIYLNNCNIKELIVEKDKVRVVLADGSTVSFARMGGDDDIIELGGNTKIETLTVTGDDTMIKAGAGVTINTLNAQADGTTLETQSGTKIGTANLDGETTITGAGTIATANVNVAGCTIDTKPDTTNVASGVTAEVGGQPITGTTPPSGGGGGGGTTIAYQSHNVANKSVPFGTQSGDLCLPASVTLTANTGATGTANATWSYTTYNPNAADAYTITGTLSGATVSWAPASITVTITVQAALTVTGGTDIADVTVKSTDSETAAKAKLPSVLTLTLSDNSTVQVSLTWTCDAAYSQTASASNTFTAAISGLPAFVSPAPSITANVNVAASDTPIATTVELSANPGSVQKPTDAISAKVVLSSIVYDQFGEVMNGQTLTYAMKQTYTGVSYGLESMVPTVTITQNAVDTSVLAKVSVGATSVSDEVEIFITDDPVVATSIEVTNFVTSMALPTAGNTTLYTFIGVIKDQNGAIMSGKTVEFEIKTPVTGVTVASDGLVTVADTTAHGVSFIVVASYSGLTSIEKTVTINKAVSVATSIGAIGGNASMTLPAISGANATAAYTAQVLDQYGAVMTAIVTWGVSGTPTGVSISASGVLTVTSAASAGSVTVTADYGSLTQMTKTVAIAKDANKVATAVTITDQGSGNIILPASVPSAGTNATRTFTAAVTDQYGDAISSPTINWSVTSAAGVSISNGVVTVTSAASVGSITVTATCGTASDTETVTIAKAASVLARITVSGPSSVVQDVGGTYTAACVDQYGATMTPTITWSIDSLPAGVSIGSSGVLTVGSSVPDNTTFAVKATSGGVSGTLDVVVNNPNIPTNLKWAEGSGGAIHMSFSKSTESTADFFTLEEYKDGALTRTTYIPTASTSTNAYTLISGAGAYTFKVIACSGNLSTPQDGTVLATSAASPTLTVTSSAAVTGFTAEYNSTTKKISLMNDVAFSGVYEGYCSTLNPTYAMISSSSPRTSADMEFPGGGDASGGLTVHQFTNTVINPDGSGTVMVSAAQSPAIVVATAVSRAPQATNFRFEMENNANNVPAPVLKWDNPTDTSGFSSYKLEHSTDGGTTWQGNWSINKSNTTMWTQALYNLSGTINFRVTTLATNGSGLEDSLPVNCGVTLTIVEGGSVVTVSSTEASYGTIGSDKSLSVNSYIGATNGADQYYRLFSFRTTGPGGTNNRETTAIFKPAVSSNAYLSGGQSIGADDTFVSGTVIVRKVGASSVTGGSATVTLSPIQNPAIPVLEPGETWTPGLTDVPVATNLKYQWDNDRGLTEVWAAPSDCTNIVSLTSVQSQNVGGDISTSSTNINETDLTELGTNVPLPRENASVTFTITSNASEGHTSATSAISASVNIVQQPAIVTFTGAMITAHPDYDGEYQVTVTSSMALPQGIYVIDGISEGQPWKLNEESVTDDATFTLTFDIWDHCDLSGITVSRIYSTDFNNTTGTGTVNVTAPQSTPIPTTGGGGDAMAIPDIALSVVDGVIIATIQPNSAYAGLEGSLHVGFVKKGDSPLSNGDFTMTAYGVAYEQITTEPYELELGDIANLMQVSHYFEDDNTLQVAAFANINRGESVWEEGSIWYSGDILLTKTAALTIASAERTNDSVTVTMGAGQLQAGKMYAIRGTENAPANGEGHTFRQEATANVGASTLIYQSKGQYDPTQFDKINYAQAGTGSASISGGNISITVTALQSKIAVTNQ